MTRQNRYEPRPARKNAVEKQKRKLYTGRILQNHESPKALDGLTFIVNIGKRIQKTVMLPQTKFGLLITANIQPRKPT